MKISLYGVFPPNIGGVSTHIYRLANRLQNSFLLSRVYVNNYTYPSVAYPNYCLNVSSRYRGNFIQKLKWMRKYLRNDTCDILHVHGSIFWDYIVVFFAVFFYKKKIVFTVHDKMQLSKSCIILFFVRLLYSFIPRVNVHFIAVSDVIRAQLNTLGLKDAFISVIPAYIPEQNSSLLDMQLIDLVKSKSIIMLYAPNLKTSTDDKIYGLTEGLKSVKVLFEEYNVTNTEVLLCIPGEIDLDLYEEVLLKSKFNTGFIHLYNKPVTNMAHLLTLLAIYFRPTSTDGDSLLVREALDCGCLVVASDVVQRPETTVICTTENYGQTGKILFESLVAVKTKKSNCKLSGTNYYDLILSCYINMCK